MSGRLAAKTILITGAARGQGAAQARMFIGQGARVVLTDLNEEEGQALADSLGDHARFQTLDVADEAAWHRVRDGIRAAEGRLDALVHNAAIYWRRSIAETRPADFRAMTEVNQIGALLALQCGLALMKEGGSVVLNSSTAGLRGAAQHGAYCAGKHAVTALAKTAAIEFAPHRIRVNSLHPGLIDTDMVRHLFAADGYEAFTTHQLIDRVGQPEEVASLALFLVSDESAFCTGGQFVVDGGTMAGRRA